MTMMRTSGRKLSARPLFAVLVVVSLFGLNAGTASADPHPIAGKWRIGTTHGCPKGTQVHYSEDSPDVLAAHPERMLQGRRATPALKKALLRAAKSHIKLRKSISCHRGHPGSPAPGFKTKADVEDSQSTNWSGYRSAAMPNYLNAGMDWTVPSVTAAPDSGGVSSIWPGVGSGDTSQDQLVQAGTEQDVQCSATCTPEYYAWYEIFPKESQQVVDNLVLSPGDEVSALVFYDSTGAEFFFSDFTTEDGFDITESLDEGTSSGSQAEWIVERTSVGATHPPLADFDVASITNPDTETGSSYDDPALENYFASAPELNSGSIWMYNDCSFTTLLANPSEFTDDLGDFSVAWDAAGQTEPPCSAAASRPR